MALRVAGILLMVTIVGLPIGVWILWRVATAKLTIHGDELVARGLGTVRVRLSEVERFGTLRVAIVAGGIGGHLARRKVGGTHAIHLCFRTTKGKTKKLMVSLFERQDEITRTVGEILGKRLEPMTMGLWGPKWS